MHDSAVNIWGIKGYYDYIRPISAIRYMAGKGQSSDAGLINYDPHGLPLIPGAIELIENNDPLAGVSAEHVGKIKIKAWKGPDFISDPQTDVAGVDWILGTRWWPYQRASFVTPPFAGYLSGHSAFSRAASEVLALLTGDEFFPGGMGTFEIPQNTFLAFEQGPSEAFTLQWATYKDASDQTSLSRIWGGIHPPIDDIRGRIIGKKIGLEAFNMALNYFNGTLSIEENSIGDVAKVYPNPFSSHLRVTTDMQGKIDFVLLGIDGKQIINKSLYILSKSAVIEMPAIAPGIYFAKLKHVESGKSIIKRMLRQ